MWLINASEVDEIGDSKNADKSTLLQGNERKYSHVHHRKYWKGSMMLKEIDWGELNGFANGFETKFGNYTVQLTNGVEEVMIETLIAKLIIHSLKCDISSRNEFLTKVKTTISLWTRHSMVIQLYPFNQKNSGMLLFV